MIQVNLDIMDSMGPGKFVHHMQNLSYTYDTYLICMGLGPSISSVIDKSLSYSGPSYPSSPVLFKILGPERLYSSHDIIMLIFTREMSPRSIINIIKTLSCTSNKIWPALMAV